MDHIIVDIATVVKPSLNVVDGTIGMEGQGPIAGEPVKLGLIAAGVDPVALDAVATAIMGFDPAEVPYLKYAVERGLGKTDLRSIVVKANTFKKF